MLTICLGKSTYARCFRGDTRVALVDGTSPTLEDMARRAESGEMFWGYSMGENGRLMAAQLQAPRYIGRDNLVAVELDNGRVIHATPDHQFMLRDGRWMAAAELQPGVSLMPLYRNLTRGYETIYHPLSGHACPTHRLADEWNLRHGLYAETAGSHRHHVDHDRLTNNPWNIVRMPAGEHIAHHTCEILAPSLMPKSTAPLSVKACNAVCKSRNGPSVIRNCKASAPRRFGKKSATPKPVNACWRSASKRQTAPAKRIGK